MKHQPDYILICAVFSLVIFGLFILSSASVVISQNSYGHGYYFLKHQLLYGVLIGLVGFFICQKIDYRRWQKFSLILLILSLFLLALVLVPNLGYGHGGAKRWVDFRIFSVQPFEFVKITFILYLSALLSKKGDEHQVIKQSIVPFLVVIGVTSLLVVLQPNMSALIIIVLIAVIIYFLARARITHLLGLAVLALAGFFALIKTAPYRISRLNVFLHPEIDPQGVGYQINQAVLAIGSGGLFGLGLGHSIQKWNYLPEVIGDSIFAIAAEEFGLIGAGILVALFVVLAWRGFRIARNAQDKFGYLLAGGITGWLFFQAIINMAAISRLVPLTGLPLPFISYGGSAMVVSLIGVGILVNISKQTR